MMLGVIADDHTGATDVASMLVRSGLRTVQIIGVPLASATIDLTEIDAVVVALKSRNIDPTRLRVRRSLKISERYLKDICSSVISYCRILGCDTIHSHR